MAFLEWDPALTLGDENIDRQHRRLLDLINKVYELADSPERDGQIMHLLTDMFLYARDHFFDEEALMDRVGYPGREAHVAEHQGFIEKTKGLADECLRDEVRFPVLLDFLADWFRFHVLTQDAKLIAYAKAKG